MNLYIIFKSYLNIHQCKKNSPLLRKKTKQKTKQIKSQQYLSAPVQANEMYLYDLKTLLKNEQYFLSYQQKLFAFVRGFMDSESCSVA